MLSPDSILQGRYRIIRQLGRGGMGAVYEALDSRVSSLVALKETFAATDELRSAFEREAKLLANLDHEAFPRVTDHFFDGEGQYLVMELVQGDDLAKLLRIREAPFLPDQVLEWADQLLDALQELHAQVPPIIHRDIKPANLKLNPKGKIKLLDFGIAKGALGHMTQYTSDPLSVMGYTPHFAPLEQTLRSDSRWLETFQLMNPTAVAAILEIATDARSDLYSLAATLYNLLTDQVPRDATTRASEVWSGRPDPLPDANVLNRQVTPAVAGVLQQAMALERQDRPINAAAMRQALRDAKMSRSETLPATVVVHPAPTRELRSGATGEVELETHRRDAGPDQRDTVEHTVAGPTIAASAPADSRAPGLSNDPRVPIDSSSAGPAIDKWAITNADAHSPRRKIIVVVAALVVVVGLLIGGIMWWRRLGASITNPNFTKNFEFVTIAPGTFEMGSPVSEDGNQGFGDETQHSVTISRGFEIGKYEITRSQWQTLTADAQTQLPKCDQCPVLNVSWNDVQLFIGKLNEQDRSYTYRLPTEAEWEYAARAGTTGPYPGNLNDIAWYDANAQNDLHPVGQKNPNAWGLFDTQGNAMEWVQDWQDNYGSTAQIDPAGPIAGTMRGLRGGSFASRATNCRAASRLSGQPFERLSIVGFRLVRVRK